MARDMTPPDGPEPCVWAAVHTVEGWTTCPNVAPRIGTSSMEARPEGGICPCGLVYLWYYATLNRATREPEIAEQIRQANAYAGWVVEPWIVEP